MLAMETPFFPHHLHLPRRPRPPAPRSATTFLASVFHSDPARRAAADSRVVPRPQHRHQHQYEQRGPDKRVDMEELLNSLSQTTSAEELNAVMAPYASRSSSHRLSTRFLSSILSHLPDFRRSLALLDWMHSIAAYSPSLVAYNVVLRNAIRAGEFSLAQGLVDEMVRVHRLPPDRFTYSTLISSFSKAGHLDLALHWLQRMERDRVPPDLVLYSSLIELARRLGDHSKAISLFTRLRRSGVAPDLVVLNSMLNVYGKAGLLGDARLLLDEMLDPSSPVYPDTVSFSTLLTAYAENERYSEALSLYSEMRECRVSLDSTTCNVMIDVYGHLGMPREADRLFWSMRNLGIAHELVSYNTLLRVYGEAELVGEAVHLFRLMQGKGIQPNVVTYNTMIQIYGKSLEHEKAGNLIPDMLKKGVQPNAITYSMIISIWEKAGKLDRAAMLFQKLRRSGVQIDKMLYQSMIVAYEKAGFVANAKQLLQELRDPMVGFDKETAISILAGTEHLEEASKMFRQAVEAGEVKDIKVFRTMMQLFARNKRHSNVVEVFENMRIAGYLPDSEMICLALDTYGKIQDVGKAEALYQDLQEEGCIFPDKVHFQMLNLLGARRKFVQMELLLGKLASDPKMNMKELYLTAANIYERANRLDDASRIMEKLRKMI